MSSGILFEAFDSVKLPRMSGISSPRRQRLSEKHSKNKIADTDTGKMIRITFVG